MNIAGIDYSLRGPAVCIFTGDYADEFKLKSCKIHFLTHVKKYAEQWGNNIFVESNFIPNKNIRFLLTIDLHDCATMSPSNDPV